MIIIDVEASGTEYEKHSIVSIGAFDFDNPDNRFYQECYIWEIADTQDGSTISSEVVCEQCGAKCPKHIQPQLQAKIMDGALEVNGFTKEEITDKNKLSEAELVAEFLLWSESVEDKTLCGQNPSFDRDFIKAACARARINWPLAYRTVDTHSLCWMHMVKRGYQIPIDKEQKRSMLNLNALLNYCGIPREPDPHNALTGALCHGEVAARLLYDKNLLPEFAEFKIPWL